MSLARLTLLLAGIASTPLVAAEPARMLVRGVDTSRLMGSPEPPPPLTIERAYPNLRFDEPLQITHAGDGSDRAVVCCRKGEIFVFPNRADVAVGQRKLFLDLRGVVATQGQEEGLMSIAFHPRYRQNGLFYVYYTVRPLASVISRFRVSADPNAADRASEEVLLTFPQPFANHNGGSIAFGPDGYLYIGLGDGGSADDPFGNGQNMAALLGKILRIDVDRRQGDRPYGIPPDNPFVGRPDARPEIWALGLRNVWRLGFDRQTGELWAADVGQNTWEEVDLIRRGGNYGWNYREGRHAFSPAQPPASQTLIDPVWEYHHSVGKSITGGTVYRGRQLPELVGRYLYADYVTGRLWALQFDGRRVLRNYEVTPPAHLPVSSFGEDEAGEIYFTSFDGYVYRFRRPASPPVDSSASFPKRLSETGVFQSLIDRVPVRGAVPYEVNVPLWSDGAGKERFVVLPAAGSVGYADRMSWDFPQGTVLVKTFFLADAKARDRKRLLETRLYVHNPQGWRGYTYVWNQSQDDAELIDRAVIKEYTVSTAAGPRRQSWYFPSRYDCDACHTKAAGFVLGLNTRQMNRGEGAQNQLKRLAAADFFRQPPPATAATEAYHDWGDQQASAEDAARAYLDVNCAVCHRPGGGTGANLDLRYHTALEKIGAVGVNPTRGRLGPKRSKIVVPGDADASELVLRMATRGHRQMPNLGSLVVDKEAVRRIAAWIEQLR